MKTEGRGKIFKGLLLGGIFSLACVLNGEEVKQANKKNKTSPESFAINPVQHSLLMGNPGKVNLDLWGWETTPFYQHVNPDVISPEYMSQRAVDESYKWGANIIEIYRGGYPLEKRAGWTKESTAAFHKHVHSRDMTIHWFPHILPPSTTFDVAVLSVANLFADQFDCLDARADELMDGMGSEQWSVMPPSLFMKCALPYSPFIYFYTDNHLFDTTLPNEQDVTATNGLGVDDQASLPNSYYQIIPEIKKQGGLQFWGTQSPECRSEIATNKFGGRGYPDWILKQVNDIFRCRAIARGSKNMSPSAFWAIHEAENMCPDNNRVYVYACGQDPLKTAVSAKFTALGAEWDCEVSRIPQRYSYPSKAAFIQNNYLNLVLMPDKDEILLQNDPERLAHWDGNSHAITLSSPFLKTISLSDNSEANLAGEVTFKHVEPAGYKSVLQADYKMKLNGVSVDETRTFTLLNDNPYVRVTIDRNIDSSSTSMGTEIPVKGYDKLFAGNKTYTVGTTIPVADIVRLVDSAGKLPELVLMLIDKGNVDKINWKPKETLILKSGAGEKEKIDLAFAIPNGLYKTDEYAELYKFIKSPEKTITLDGEKGTEIRNEFDIPVVKVLKVQGNKEDPYQVYEFGRWVFRGAQVAGGAVKQGEKGYDYLKVYLPAKGTAKIKKYGFINDTAKNGWGCQYTTALKDILRDGNKCQATAEVLDITSFIFAPRVAFKNPIQSVKLNGREWRYFEGNNVFLPNRRGTYKIEVIEGTALEASLARTFADVAESDFSDGKLTFTARLPEWTESIPEDYYFYAMINHPGKSISSLENAELCRKVDGKASVIRFGPGRVTVGTGDVDSGKNIAMIDQELDIEKHLRKKEVERVLPYLKPFKTRTVYLEDIASGKENLSDCDVIVWNHYFQDKLPAVTDKGLADILRKQVEDGKGLLLICNAMKIAPEILGIETKVSLLQMQTRHGQINRNRVQAIGILVDQPDHPIFKELDKDENGKYTLIKFEPFDLFKRAKWENEPEIIVNGEALAGMYVQPVKGVINYTSLPAFSDGKVIREWVIGKGKMIGHYQQLRYAYGSIDKSTPTDNAIRLIHNIVKYLGDDKKEIRVVVIE